MIHVIAAIELHPGRREDFLAEFRKIIPPVRAEEGCIEYGPTVDTTTDIPAQAAPRPDTVTIVEKWASVDHLKRHLAAPHMEAYRPRVKDMIVRTTLTILTPA